MRFSPLIAALIFWMAFGFPGASRADVPATEFFAIETSKLAKLAPTEESLDLLSATQLSGVSLAHGWYSGGLSMKFDMAAFRMDARFSASVRTPAGDPAFIGYNISASNDPTSWSLLSVQGTATKHGTQFVTENWRKQPVTVILRFLDLKK